MELFPCFIRCAAPGSKTSQILETLTVSDTQDGFVVANDASEKRGYMLVHQLLRLGLLSAVVTCHQGQDFPGLYDPTTQHLHTTNAFDRVLCDVPCTGDGTLRKNENIWRHWHVGDGLTLHPIQLEIAMRGAALLKVGGTMVYSTCSFNPIENEAVVAELIRRSDGALRLVEVALPGLKHRQGLTTWQVGWQSKTKAKKQRHITANDDPTPPIMAWYRSFSEDIPADLRGYRLTRSMFPPDEQDGNVVHLERCLRFVPHDQNTGGFFVAVLEKVAPLPGADEQGQYHSTLPRHCDSGYTGAHEEDAPSHENATADEVSAGVLKALPPSVWGTLQDFYGLPDTFPSERLFARSHGTGIVSYVSSSVQAACLAGPDLKATAPKFRGMAVGPAVVVLQQAQHEQMLPVVGLSIWVGHTSLAKLVTTSDLSILADHLCSLDASAYEP
ncbi:hypothetical protein DYB36_002938 [Aphanomyces astaci]|uniref:SAM-dependent MTase RsmB/NOP-type domain-containing protein n=1 Tax=Aphanomyces astaci TaxID=112090 RepID=A0A397A6D8_APHAT|nr:hypothetical protein DYB36_002938 [Aphanomyces astaci]